MNLLDINVREIRFDEVAVNGVPSYRRMCLRNRDANTPITVRLSCVHSFVKFQLQNENLMDGTPDLISSYNEVFDTVGLLEKIELLPLETCEVIVSFRADPTFFPHIVAQSPPTLFTGKLQLAASPSLSSLSQQIVPLGKDVSLPKNISGNLDTSNNDVSIFSSVDSSQSPVFGRSPDVESRRLFPPSTTVVRSESLQVAFSASVYLSLLQVSTNEVQAAMPPNKTQIIDFSVANMSFRPLAFVVRNQTIPSKDVELSLYEAEKLDEPIFGRRLLLDSYSSTSLSLLVRTSPTATPISVHQYQGVLQCDNLNNICNTTNVYVTINMVTESQSDLVSVSEKSLNFGDVYRGAKSIVTLGFRNIEGREDATVRLSAAQNWKSIGSITLMKEDESITDEITVPAQKGMVYVKLMYIAAVDVDEKGSSKVKFEVDFSITSGDGTRQQRIVVRCSAMLFTSTIVTSQSSINFGDCCVGQSKRCTFSIENKSPIPGVIVVQLRSKIVSIEGVAPRIMQTGNREIFKEFSIAPCSSLSITLRITPQRVNPTYRKQLTIINVSNPSEERQIINIESNNIAPMEAKIHDEAYTWEYYAPDSPSSRGENTTTLSNLCALTNVPLIVPYLVCSQVDRPLVLDIRTSSPEIDVLYIANDTVLSNKESSVGGSVKNIDSLPVAESTNAPTSSGINRSMDTMGTNITSNREFQPLTKPSESEGESRFSKPALVPSGSSKAALNRDVSHIEAQLESISAKLRSYCMYGDEELFQKSSVSPEKVSRIRDELLEILSAYAVVTSHIVLAPNAAMKVYALILRTPFTSEAVTKEDGLSVSLEGIEIPRFVRLSYRLCATTFELGGQRTKNFGEVNIGLKKVTNLSIVNRCNSVLFLKISKSMSVTAGHIRLENNDKQSIFRCIRPYATKEVELAFFPGIKGSFEEKVTLTNVLDPSNEIVVTVKATVTKADTFDVSPDSWSFGIVVVPPLEDPPQSASVGAKFTVSNTSKARRDIRLKLDVTGNGSESTASSNAKVLRFFGVDVKIQLQMQHAGFSSGSSRRIEEEIEKLEQKLKIYQRKKKQEKILAAACRIEALKRALMGEEVELGALDADGAQENAPLESEDEGSGSTGAGSNPLKHIDVLSLLLRDGVLLPPMNAGESVTITFGVICTRISGESIPTAQTNTINLLLFEEKDQEVNRIVPLDLTLVRSEAETDSPAQKVISHPDIVPALNLTQQQSFIFLEPFDALSPSMFMGYPMIFLRNSIVNDHVEFSILVKASNNTAFVVLEPRCCSGSAVEALDCKFKFSPRNGSLRANEPLRILVEATPRRVGPQKYFIPVKNLQNASDVQYFVVELNPTEEEELIQMEPKRIVFKDIITPCDAQKIEPHLLLIRCRYPSPHALLVRTNKPSQISFFEDPHCRIPLSNPIPRSFAKETARVYLQYTPSFKSNQHKSRVMIAGVIVEAIIMDDKTTEYRVVGTASARVEVRVGSGELKLEEVDLDLGVVPPIRNAIQSSVNIINPSDVFRIRAKLVTFSPNLVIEGQEEVLIGPLEKKVIPLSVFLSYPGLFREHISVVNLSCGQSPIKVTIVVLRQDESVTAMLPSGANDSVKLPTAYVANGENGKFKLFSSVSTSFPIRNRCTKDLIIACKSSLPIRFGPRDNNEIAILESVERSLDPSTSRVGGRVRLEARHIQTVMWALSETPEFTDDQIEELKAHRLVTIQARVQVHVVQIIDDVTGLQYTSIFNRSKRALPSVQQCVLWIPFIATFALSEGHLEPSSIDFGTVGLLEKERARNQNSLDSASGDAGINRLEDKETVVFANLYNKRKIPSDLTFQVNLTNLSKFLPLSAMVVCPASVKFSAHTISIAPASELKIDASLHLSSVQTQGPFRYDIFFINEHNPENEMTLTLTGQYYWKVLSFSCNFMDDIRDSITLPFLCLDTNVITPSILSEVKLTVSATEVSDIEVNISIALNPTLKDLIELQVLHYGSTSTVEKLVFGSLNSVNGPVNNAGPMTAQGLGNAADGSNASPMGPSNTSSNTTVTNAPTSTRLGPKAYRSTSAHQEHLRLRCVLRQSDPAALSSVFFGSRKKRTLQELYALSFDKLASYKQKCEVANSQNIWLGSVSFFNTLTGDEELQVFGNMKPFSTFSAPIKLVVRRVQERSHGTFPKHSSTLSNVSKRSTSFYAGEITVVNTCEGYATELYMAALMSSTYESGTLSVECSIENIGSVASHDNGGTSKKVEPVVDDKYRTNIPAIDPPRLNSSALFSRRFRLEAGESAVIAVTLKISDCDFHQNALLQSQLEQHLVFLITDENVPFSITVTRLSVAPAPEQQNEVASDNTNLYPEEEHHVQSSSSQQPQLPPVQEGDMVVEAMGGNTNNANNNNSSCSTALNVSANNNAVELDMADSGAPGGAEYLNLPALTPMKTSILELRNCTPVAGCPGAYSCAYSFAKEESPVTDIMIRNTLSNRSVEYSVTVTSQGPQPWLLLSSTSAVLDSGESQPLRLNILSNEVGSFVGYVTISNNVKPHDVVLLRLSAEIFTPSTGEDLFEVNASNGQRVATNAIRNVTLGHLYGANTVRTYIALEIFNRGNVALEFPVSVIKPFHLQIAPIENHSIAMRHFLHRARRECTSDTIKAEKLPEDAISETDSSPKGASSENARGHAEEEDDSMFRNTSEVENPTSSLITKLAQKDHPFEGRLVVCHIHGVPTHSGQHYFVVDPKSRIRLAFVLTCSGLRVPEGYGVLGEADIVFKCKQARDAQFTFRAKFEAYSPTLLVRKRYELDPKTNYESRVCVQNILPSQQTVAFRTQSPVLSVIAVEGTNKYHLSASIGEMDIPPKSSATFVIRLDYQRTAALLNFDAEDEVKPIICEHAFILNVYNPKERIRIQFTQTPPSGSAQQATNRIAQAENPNSLLSKREQITAHPVKIGGQHINEAYIVRFVRLFHQTLEKHAEKIMCAFKYYESTKNGEATSEMISTKIISMQTSTSSAESSWSSSNNSMDSPHSVEPLISSADQYCANTSTKGLVYFLSQGTTTSNASLVNEHGASIAEKSRQKSMSDSPALARPIVSFSDTNQNTNTSNYQGNTTTGASTVSHQKVDTRSPKKEYRLGLTSSAWRQLFSLLVELTWLVDELVFYSILLRNSRLIEGYCVFLTAAVSNHSVMKAWRRYKHVLPAPSEYSVFSQFLATLDALPCPTPSAD